MPVPRVYMKNPEGQNTVYDFQDFAEGSGVVTLYGGTVAGAMGALSRNQFAADEIQTTYSSVTTSFTSCIDMDFDMTVNKPFIMNGSMIVTVPVLPYVNGGGDDNHYCEAYCKVYIRKYSGGAETEFESATSDHITFAWTSATENNYNHEKLLTVELFPNMYKYNKGDLLRLSVEVAAKYGGTGGSFTTKTVTLGHDPLNRTTGSSFASTEYTRLTFFLPIWIDT